LQKSLSLNKEWSARAIPLLNEVVGYFGLLLRTHGGGQLLLLIACINVANLMLARAPHENEKCHSIRHRRDT
jgi:hypothetical protein